MITPGPHTLCRRAVDDLLVSDAAAPHQADLQRHLESCASCRRYLEQNMHVIATLDNYSFAVDPSLQTDVLRALELRAQELNNRPVHRVSLMRTGALAVLFTLIGSFVDLRIGSAVAAIHPLRVPLPHPDLLTFWIVSSIFPLLLFPLVPLLVERKERLS